MPDYYTLEDSDAIALIKDTLAKCHLPNLNWVATGDNKQKEPIKITIVNKLIQTTLKTEVIFTINENIYDLLQDESKQLVVDRAIAHISMDLENSIVKKIMPEITEHKSILRKYGVDKIEALQAEIKQLVKGDSIDEDEVE